MDADAARRLVELVEKMGLLRRDLQHKGDMDRYAARVARIDQKVIELTDALSSAEPTLAAAITTAWAQPARSLAFRNAAHTKQRREPS